MITQTFTLNSSSPQVAEPSPPISLRVPTKERSSEFLPKPVPDIAPIQATRVQINLSITNASDQYNQLTSKLEAFAEAVRQHQLLINERRRLQEKALQTEAQALVDDVAFDSTKYESKIEELSARIKLTTRDVAAAKAVLPILESKRDKVTDQLAKLQKELAAATANWLKVRHTQLIEAFRSEFHELHRTMAKIIAVENSTNFAGFEDGWAFLEELSAGVGYRSEFRPDWLNVHTRRSFPGFANAAVALDDEMETAEVPR
ncbi:hypothetical protein LJR251_000290 [Rhizobium rhizogenes]|uniref:hypothetical protein n=1 Tax=Rhizobium rhizogenes TaxID=359 RepID=UPI003ECC31A2